MQLATLLKAKAAAFLCKLMEQVKLLLQALGDTRAEIRSILHPTQEGERDTASKPKVLDAQVRGCLPHAAQRGAGVRSSSRVHHCTRSPGGAVETTTKARATAPSTFDSDLFPDQTSAAAG